jgi:glutathione S-transferase
MFKPTTTQSSSFSATIQEKDDILTTTESLPSWEELKEMLPENDIAPKVTLYRDTNGWCPFCERVWLALRVKNVPYTETLISLQNKPQWYKDLVPTTLVPAVLFYGGDSSNERKIVWESNEILKELDRSFPDTPRLMLDDDPNFIQAQEMNDELQTAGFQYIFNSTMSISATEQIERKEKFMSCLDDLDNALGEQNGPFRLGAEFTGIDAIMVPTLERWRYQMPINKDMDILEGRPNLSKWFEAMDDFGPYKDRVAGDEYSWTATNSMILRFFGSRNSDDKDDNTAQKIQRSDDKAQELVNSFHTYTTENELFALEAATKLISYHEAVIADCSGTTPVVSQNHIPRTNETAVADEVLRLASSILLSPMAVQSAQTISLTTDSPDISAKIARTVAQRLCVPRDMGAPAAAILRSVLCTVAHRLEEKEKS